MSQRIVRVCLAACVAISMVAEITQAQTSITITGTVRTDAGTPIVGATIFSSTLRTGALTRDDGTYRLVVADSLNGRTIALVARRLGFREVSAQVAVTAPTTTRDFVLAPSAVQLTGIVVSALSLQREKSTIGTSQQEVSSSDLTRTHDPNIVNSLSGKVSGVQISGSGNIGGSSRIVIRGASSINGNNQPLFIVDGVPVANGDNNSASAATANGGYDFGNAIRDLNPDDIASITVLKGPNAAALYGSRAANGAIVITTKAGRGNGDGTRVTASSYYTMDSFSRLPKYQNLYGQGSGGQFKFVDGAGGGVQDGNDQSFGPRLDGQPRDQFTGPGMPWIAHPDNVKDYFVGGATLNNNLSITASSGPANARLSVSNEQVKGIIPNSSTRKTTASVNGGVQVNDRFNVSSSISYIENGAQNRPGTGYNVSPLEQFIWFGRQVDIDALKARQYDANGNLFNWNYNFHNNPYWLQYDNPEADQRNRVIAQVTANYQLLPWLKFLGRAGTDTYRESIRLRWAQGNLVWADPSYAGAFNFTDNRATGTNTEGIFTANTQVGKFDLTGNLGGSLIRNSRFSNTVATGGLSVAGIYNVSNAAITPTVTNADVRSGENAIYGSALLTYNKWWTLEATARNDWSSTLPKENASYFYPSVSTSIILSDLFPSLSSGAISYLKIRGGYAQVGAPAQPYQLQTTYTGLSNKFGSAPLFTLGNTIANANLKPERTSGAEGGLEFSLWGDRVVFDGTLYNKITKDQVLNLTVAPATGFNAVAINAGQISNRGFEAQLSLRPIRTKALEWTSTFNFSRNRNKVDALTPGLSTVVLGTNWSVNVEAREGQPQGVLFGAPFLRDSASGKLITSEGLPQADNAHRRVLGNYNPDWTGGWFNEFRHGRLTLGVLVDVKKGGQIFSSGNMFGTYTGVFANTVNGREVDWDKPGITVQGIDDATGQPNTTNVTAEQYYQSLYGIHEAFVYDAGFVKLREVRLTWDFSPRALRLLGVSSGNVALVGRNLLMRTKFPNFDPENAYSSGNVQGFDFASTPTVRTFGLNLTVTP